MHVDAASGGFVAPFLDRAVGPYEGVVMPEDRPVALVTGASRGIGKACAIHLAGRGYDVVVGARTMHDGVHLPAAGARAMLSV